MHKLPVRFVDNCWQVLVPHGCVAKWISCRSKSDARQMAVSGNLVFEVQEPAGQTAAAATELELCAALFRRYGCKEQALWLDEYAKLARGELSFSIRAGD